MCISYYFRRSRYLVFLCTNFRALKIRFVINIHVICRIHNSPPKNYILKTAEFSSHTHTLFLNNHFIEWHPITLGLPDRHVPFRTSDWIFLRTASQFLIHLPSSIMKLTQSDRHTRIRINPWWGGTSNAVLKRTNMTALSTPLTVPNSVLHASALMKLDWVCSVQTEMGNYMTNENVCWKPRTLLVVICQLHKYVSNCAYRDYVFHKF